MPFVGSIIPQRVLGLGQQDRQARRAKDERKEDPAGARVARAGDEAEITAPDAVTAASPPDEVDSNDSERAREDHEADIVGGVYDRRGGDAGGSHPRIDVEA